MVKWLRNLLIGDEKEALAVIGRNSVFSRCPTSVLQEILDTMIRYLAVSDVVIQRKEDGFFRVRVDFNSGIRLKKGSSNKIFDRYAETNGFDTYEAALLFAVTRIWNSLGNLQQEFLLSLFLTHLVTCPRRKC